MRYPYPFKFNWKPNKLCPSCKTLQRRQGFKPAPRIEPRFYYVDEIYGGQTLICAKCYRSVKATMTP